MNRLVFGVDNIHFDVYISPQVYNALKRTTTLLMIKHSRSEYFFKNYKREFCEIEKDTLKRVCTDALLDGIAKAKLAAEVQIDYLGQAALAKMFLEEIRNQYKILVAHFEPMLRTYQLSQRNDQNEGFIIKDKLADIKLNQNQIIRLVGEELFYLLADIQARNLRNMRETHFLPQDILPDNFFINPILHTDNPADDFFLIEEYVLLGQRSEDPDNYASVKRIIYELLGKTDLGQGNDIGAKSPGTDETRDKKNGLTFDVAANKYDPWIMETGNVDRMFNYFDSHEQYIRAKSAKESKELIQNLKEQKITQKNLLNLFYYKFKKSCIIKQIVAAFEVKSVYGNYCPPMVPRQIRESLVDFWSRKSIIRQLKRRKSVHGKDFVLAPLHETVKRINNSSTVEKKHHLLMFLNQFFRYYRDLYNYRILKEGMDAINLATEEKIILLSRGNRSLFEFLLPEERGKEEKSISNHVIIKADIRGSMNINHTMTNKRIKSGIIFQS